MPKDNLATEDYYMNIKLHFGGAKLKLFLNARFNKLPADIDNSTTKLIGVSITNFEDLTPAFISFDTELPSGEHYQLPEKGKCIILTLLTRNTSTIDIWYDIRRWTKQRECVYRNNIYREIKVIIKNKGC